MHNINLNIVLNCVVQQMECLIENGLTDRNTSGLKKLLSSDSKTIHDAEV